jgi:hypothetical protein
MSCGGALEPKLQHAHFCFSTALQRLATLEPTSSQKPERRAELPYMFTAILSRGRVQVNGICIRVLFETAFAIVSADRYANGRISPLRFSGFLQERWHGPEMLISFAITRSI